jgi:hypothetical protein
MATQQIVQSTRSATLADVLDRVLDKGLVVAGEEGDGAGDGLLEERSQSVIALTPRADEP